MLQKGLKTNGHDERKAPRTDGLAQVAEGYYGSDSTSVMIPQEPLPTWKLECPSGQITSEDGFSCMYKICGNLVPANGPFCPMASCIEPKCPSGQITSEDGFSCMCKICGNLVPADGPFCPEASCEPLVGGCAGTEFGCCPEDSWYPDEAAWGPKGKGCYDFRDPMDALQKAAKKQKQDKNANRKEEKADQEKRIADGKEKKADREKRT